MNQPTFTEQELAAIVEALDRMISDGLVESDDDPIVTAYEKITGQKVYDDEES